MKLTEITFGNYKAFPNLNSIEIKPLTIFIGRNSSGKSVLSRLPILIARAMSDRAEAPLELEFSGFSFGNELVDLIYNHKTHGAINIGVTLVNDDGVNMKIDAIIQHYYPQKIMLISYFQFHKGDDQVFTLTWAGKDPVEDCCKYMWEEEGLKISVDFRGCLPQFLDSEPNKDNVSIKDKPFTDDFNVIGKYFTESIEKTTYLGPFREEPQLVYRYPTAEIKSVGLKGKNAPIILGIDDRNPPSQILDSVGKWFTQYLGGWRLGVDRQEGDGFSIVMINPEDPLIKINMVDVGIGITQVLPIVVQRRFEEITRECGDIEIVEQPELHLHSGAHGDLADLYINSVRESDTKFIIETHSENFLLRVRRRIAEGFDHNKAIIYWIKDEPRQGSRIIPIRIDECGEVDNWPEGVWAEDFEEVKHIRKAQKENKKCK